MTKGKIKTINLYDHFWQVELAVQRLILIKKTLGIKCKDYADELDFVLEKEKIEIDKDGNFETSCGYLTIKGYKDENGKQKIDFYFDLASN